MVPTTNQSLAFLRKSLKTGPTKTQDIAYKCLVAATNIRTAKSSSILVLTNKDISLTGWSGTDMKCMLHSSVDELLQTQLPNL